MKVSNIILIALLLSTVLMIGSTSFVIRAKYRSRNYSSVIAGDRNFNLKTFAGLRYVKIINISACIILPTDTLKTGFENSAAFTSGVSADTVVIRASGNTGAPGKLKLYLPASVLLSAINSKLELHGNNNNDLPPAYTIDLVGSALISFDGLAAYRQNFGDLHITASDNSSIRLLKNDNVRNLSLTLRASYFTCSNSAINKIQIVSDSESVTSIRGNNKELEFNQAAVERQR